MKEEYIKTFNNQIIGIIETYPNGDQAARAFPSRQVLGYYRAISNITTDFYGRILARGNTVVSLIYNQQNKK